MRDTLKGLFTDILGTQRRMNLRLHKNCVLKGKLEFNRYKVNETHLRQGIACIEAELLAFGSLSHSNYNLYTHPGAIHLSFSILITRRDYLPL